MEGLMLPEAFTTCLLAHIVFIMYYSDKLRATIPTVKLFKRYTIYIASILGLFTFFIVMYDVATGNSQNVALFATFLCTSTSTRNPEKTEQNVYQDYYHDGISYWHWTVSLANSYLSSTLPHQCDCCQLLFDCPTVHHRGHNFLQEDGRVLHQRVTITKTRPQTLSLIFDFTHPQSLLVCTTQCCTYLSLKSSNRELLL